MDLSFSVNIHDKDGDAYDKCILIFFGDNTILRFNNLVEYNDFINQLSVIKQEIDETYTDGQV